MPEASDSDYKACSEDVLDLYSVDADLSPVAQSRRYTVLVLACDPEAPPAPGAIIGKCDYYCWRYQNFEQRHLACEHDPPDYYLDFGLYYCRMFGVELSPKLSPEGKAWLAEARRLLQVYMEREIAADNEVELDSDRFREMAFDTHPRAYTDAGLTKLPFWSWEADRLKICLQPDFSEWIHWRTWRQAIFVAGSQLSQWGSDTVTIASDAYHDTVTYVSEKASAVSDEIREYFTGLFK